MVTLSHRNSVCVLGITAHLALCSAAQAQEPVAAPAPRDGTPAASSTVEPTETSLPPPAEEETSTNENEADGQSKESAGEDAEQHPDLDTSGGSTAPAEEARGWDDRRDIPEPRQRNFNSYSYFAEVLTVRSWTRGLALRDKDPAQNVNALDEVPNSTWFQNRIGARMISPEEAARGPVKVGPPQLPLTVTRGKDTGGGNPGFFAKDPTGRMFLIKFDPRTNPEMQTAPSVVVNRVFWTLGYNVPEDTVFEFARSDLALAPDAKMKESTGKEASESRYFSSHSSPRRWPTHNEIWDTGRAMSGTSPTARRSGP